MTGHQYQFVEHSKPIPIGVGTPTRNAEANGHKSKVDLVAEKAGL